MLELGCWPDFDGAVELWYRHLHQGEEYASVAMVGDGVCFRATIPGRDTADLFPLMYFFMLRASSGDAWIAPGLDETLANQPYYVLRGDRAGADRARRGAYDKGERHVAAESGLRDHAQGGGTDDL